MPGLPLVSAVISDPPYNVGLADWDIPVQQSDLDLCRSKAPVVIWFGAALPRCQKHILSLEPLCTRILLWKKAWGTITSNGTFWKYQPIYVWGEIIDLGSDVLEEISDYGYHPAQKPESLMRRLILAACPNGGTILDPWAGSGTTLRAAKDLGMKAIGIEMREDYCNIAARRLGQEILHFSPPKKSLDTLLPLSLSFPSE